MGIIKDFLNKDDSHLILEWGDTTKIKQYEQRIKELEWENQQMMMIITRLRKESPLKFKKLDTLDFKKIGRLE